MCSRREDLGGARTLLESFYIFRIVVLEGGWVRAAGARGRAGGAEAVFGITRVRRIVH